MNYKSSFVSTMGRSFITAGGIKGASLLKTSYIVGSHAAFFSASSIALPLMGAWNRIPNIMATIACSLALRCAFGAAAGTSVLPILAFWIPGLCAALYWQISSRIYRLGLPLACMALFVLNPVGMAAAPYAFYWFIPMSIALMRSQSIWLHALASTFTAHAVGSVIWLYTVPMTAAAWVALIPIVACERALYAAGIVVGNTAIAWCMSYKSVPTEQGVRAEKIHA